MPFCCGTKWVGGKVVERKKPERRTEGENRRKASDQRLELIRDIEGGRRTGRQKEVCVCLFESEREKDRERGRDRGRETERLGEVGNETIMK